MNPLIPANQFSTDKQLDFLLDLTNRRRTVAATQDDVWRLQLHPNTKIGKPNKYSLSKYDPEYRFHRQEKTFRGNTTEAIEKANKWLEKGQAHEPNP